MFGHRRKAQRRRWRRVVAWTIAAVFLPVVLAIGGLALWLQLASPTTNGKLDLAGLRAAVEIRRDSNGIPFVRAANAHDLYFAQGFLHAQDRLLQMDMMRLTARGRLAEFLGTAALPSDRMMRALELARLAEESHAALGTETREALAGYAAGVNAYLMTAIAFPPEFRILGRMPEPWSEIDSLLWGSLMALQLSGNWRNELLRAHLLRTHDTKKLRWIWPGWDGNAERAALDDIDATLLAALPTPPGPAHASNSWVLDGRHTASGKPLLANDPHLQLAAPGVWYLMRLETPELTIVGASAPGLPGIVLGHNSHVAWGMTTTGIDAADVFIERLVDGPRRYATPEGPRDFDTRSHVIAVKGQSAPVTMTIRWSRHGPVLQDFVSLPPRSTDPNHVLALALTLHHDINRSADALTSMNRASDVPMFISALRNWHSPMQNISVADTRGQIAMVSPGWLPQRRGGNGAVPSPGWDGERDWIGAVPFERLPHIASPPGGVISNANERLAHADPEILITGDWDTDHRGRRVIALLAASQLPHDAATSAAMQRNAVSQFALDIRDALAAWQPEKAAASRAASLLMRWDGAMSRDRAEPLIFSVWMRVLRDKVLRAWFGDDAALLETSPRSYPGLLLALVKSDPGLCAQLPCAKLVEDALIEALQTIERRYGQAWERWRWGDAHRAPLVSPLLERIPVIGAWLALDIPTDGDGYALNNGTTAFDRDPLRLRHVHGPSLRAIYDLADLESARFMIVPGQSGAIFARHARDLAPLWAEGSYLTLSRAELSRAGRVLNLAPRGGAP
jgi:penicillin amidase